jgi:squalene-hopene/tetraprenyl-beta-curcumene cyclase
VSALALANTRPHAARSKNADCNDSQIHTSRDENTLASDDLARVESGVTWLVEHHNHDGGWGDTIDSPSNLATTLLAIAALKLADAAGVDSPKNTVHRALRYVAMQSNGAADATVSSDSIVAAIRRAYGADRTFAVPILMNCALAGLVSWSEVPSLPFELAVFPHGWYKALRLHVVSYALPALIAIGLAIDSHHPPRSKIQRWIRRKVMMRVLKKLAAIQPSHGGFLDAAPLTSFSAMGLISRFGPEQPVAVKCLAFLRQSQRADGSWPIDTNLAIWLTTSAIVSLEAAGESSSIDRSQTGCWIAAQQYAAMHSFTQAAPGGWAWTHLPGGVPDADDTAGAILALTELGKPGDVYRDSISAGVQWLLDLQNSDGGWPTFCRGWGKLPFDQSAPDLTAHVLRAFSLVKASAIGSPVCQAIHRGLQYLGRIQQTDGSWIPLWFGNQKSPGQINPVIGTSLVLRALEIFAYDSPETVRGVEYLCQAQNTDGGWGGTLGVPSSAEESALAVAALAGWHERQAVADRLARGVRYLVEHMGEIEKTPAPIGLYFSRLWYSEPLYPMIWTLEALGRIATDRIVTR